MGPRREVTPSQAPAPVPRRADRIQAGPRPKGLSGLSLDDERLRQLSIGVQMIGNDATNTPLAHALSRRGLIQNVRGFTLYAPVRRAPELMAEPEDNRSSGELSGIALPK